MAIARYQKKISGPLIDRIDIHVEVPRVDYEKLTCNAKMGPTEVCEFCELEAQFLAAGNHVSLQ